MSFHHEKLTVYQRSLEFAAWSQDRIDSLTNKTSTRDHLERAGDSIALNLAEGNRKFSQRDRARFFQIANGSALECAACLDLLVARRCCERAVVTKGKLVLEEIVKMLFAMLDQLGCRIAEDSPEYSSSFSSSSASLLEEIKEYGEREEAEEQVEED
jgi:four helix bundle protein